MAQPVDQARRVPLVALLGANTISLVGSQLTAVAIPWFVLITTGSAAKTGAVAFCELAPTILAAFFGGALIDRLGHWRASIGADLVSGLTVALIPLLYTTVGLAFWQLLAIVFCGALFTVPGTTARSALLPELTALARQPIERATSATQAVGRGSRLIGAPLAGLMIAALGPTAPLWIDGASFLVSAVLIASLVPSATSAAGAEAAEGPQRGIDRYLADLREGLAFIRGDRLMLVIVGQIMITNLLDAVFAVALPVYANHVYGTALALGLLFAASGGGAMVSAVLFGIVGARLPRRATYIWAFILNSLCRVPLLLFPPLPVALLAQVCSGLTAGPLNPIFAAVQYERVPAALRGRVIGVISAGASLGMPLGVLLSGVSIERIGLRPVLAILVLTYLACTTSMLAIPALRELDRPGRRNDAGAAGKGC